MTSENMMDLIKIERNKLKEFLKQPYDNYRWYPKPAWYINIKNMMKSLIDIINMDLVIEDDINNIYIIIARCTIRKIIHLCAFQMRKCENV